MTAWEFQIQWTMPNLTDQRIRPKTNLEAAKKTGGISLVCRALWQSVVQTCRQRHACQPVQISCSRQDCYLTHSSKLNGQTVAVKIGIWYTAANLTSKLDDLWQILPKFAFIQTCEQRTRKDVIRRTISVNIVCICRMPVEPGEDVWICQNKDCGIGTYHRTCAAPTNSGCYLCVSPVHGGISKWVFIHCIPHVRLHLAMHFC